MQEIIVNTKEEKDLIQSLESKNDPESLRLKRFFSMPDLSRTAGSPIYELVQKVISDPGFPRMDIITAPEIVPTNISFDLFDFPADHPTRSRSDTYYIDDNHIMRTHTTVMWYYYLHNEDVKKRMAAGEPVGCFSFGKVYRKDEIDRNHMNVFHQIDAWYLAPKDKQVIGIPELQQALLAVAQAAFGKEVRYRFNPESFPFTDPSLEMEIDKNGNWLEVLGSGVVKGSVLDKLGVDSRKWNGWAFGTGIERLAMISMDLPDIRLLWSNDERVKKQLKLGNKYKEVSKYPAMTRDFSFIVKKDFVPNDYYDMIRDIGGDLVEQVELLDKYEDDKKFGPDKVSYTFRVICRSVDRTLTTDQVRPIQEEIYQRTAKDFKAELR